MKPLHNLIQVEGLDPLHLVSLDHRAIAAEWGAFRTFRRGAGRGWSARARAAGREGQRQGESSKHGILRGVGGRRDDDTLPPAGNQSKTVHDACSGLVLEPTGPGQTMYDATFDQSPHSAPASDRRFLWAIRIAALLGVAIAGAADAQLPGAPVLQNAWATPGLVAAVNLGGGSDGSVYAAAVGWSPGSGRFQLSAGAGAQSRTGTGSKGAYGLRVAVPLGGASSAHRDR